MRIINSNIAFLIIFYLLGPFIGYLSLNYFNIAFLNILSGLIFFNFLVLCFFSLIENRKIYIPTYAKYYMLFILYTVFSDIFISHLTLNFKYFYSNYLIPSGLFIVIINNLKPTKSFINIVMKLFLVIFVISVIVILIQEYVSQYFYANPDYFTAWLDETRIEMRLPSIFSWVDPSESGFTFIAIAALTIEYYIKKNKIEIALVFLLFTTVFAFLTKFRWILLNGTMLSFLFLSSKSFRIKNFVLTIFFSILIIIGVVNYSAEINIPFVSILQERFFESRAGGLGHGSSYSRVISAYVFIELFPKNPILGKGKLHTTEKTSRDYELQSALGGRSSQIHIGYLSLLYYYGIVGGVIFFMFVFYLIKELLNKAKTTKYWAPFLIFLGYLLANTSLVALNIHFGGLYIALFLSNYHSNNLNKC